VALASLHVRLPLLEGLLRLLPRADGELVPVEEDVQVRVLVLYLLDLVVDLTEGELRIVPVYPDPDSLAQRPTRRRDWI
jgi:hypothetical protein